MTGFDVDDGLGGLKNMGMDGERNVDMLNYLKKTLWVLG